MPEVPTPVVNGHVTSLRLLQASRSISSFAPAAAIDGMSGLTATAGSFCLFCGNGFVGLPELTRVSPPLGVAPARAVNANTNATASDSTRSFLISLLPFLCSMTLRGSLNSYDYFCRRSVRVGDPPGGTDRKRRVLHRGPAGEPAGGLPQERRD